MKDILEYEACDHQELFNEECDKCASKILYIKDMCEEIPDRIVDPFDD